MTVPPDHAPTISTGRLPVTGRDLFGRERELAWLDQCWAEGVRVATIVAWGGVGKSALVNAWLRRMDEAGWRGAERVYGWSFYSQGTDRLSSSDEFVDAALRWFGDPAPEKGSPWDKGERLAARIRKERAILVLDGVEPLQWEPGVDEGRLKDPALQMLVKGLGVQNKGLCLITTRIAVADLEGLEGDRVQARKLEHLSKEAGADLLKSRKAWGTEEELQAAAEEYKGHGLALTLLGTYLRKAHKGDIRKRDLIPPMPEKPARRMMAIYEEWFKDKPELAILRVLGLFDRPAPEDEIAAVREAPAIVGLTTALEGLPRDAWNEAVTTLRDVGLLAGSAETEEAERLDAHPLVRSYFGEQLRQQSPEAWQEGHDRLYRHLRHKTTRYPETIEAMSPLYSAMVHGCLAKRHQEALREVWWKRIQREQHFSSKKLGAFGSEVAVLSAFFDPPWERLVQGLSGEDGADVLNVAGVALRALGRLPEAAELMRMGLDRRIAQKNWKEAAVSSSNFGELLQSRGDLRDALEQARKSVELANRSGDTGWRMANRTVLAAALHAMGLRDEAATQFEEAEQLEKDRQARFPFLVSLPGFRYCDLLLDQGRDADVRKRAEQTLPWVEAQQLLLDIALDHLSIGRAHLLAVQRGGTADLAGAAFHLAASVDGFRQAGTQHHLPLGLLARAALRTHTRDFALARHDLNEALTLAQRCGFRLHEADAHLGLARLSLAEGAPAAAAHPHIAAAGAHITATGYHRRDGELRALEEALAAKQEEEKTARAQGSPGPDENQTPLPLASLAPLAVPSDPPAPPPASPPSIPTPGPAPVPVPEKARPMPAPLRLVYSYSHKDEAHREDLEAHLALLRRQGLIEGWDDRRIGARTDGAAAVDDNLAKADVVLLLISADFIASDYCYCEEMTRAIARHDAGEARVILVTLRPCDWSGAPFARLQTFPRDRKPVTKWKNRDEAWLDVAAGIRGAVEELQKRRAQGVSASPR